MAEMARSTKPPASSDSAAYLAMLGGRVRARRLACKLSRRGLSERSGVSERFSAHLEAGEGNISIVRLKAIADALEVPLETIIAERPPERPVSREDWRTHPGAIAELFMHADPNRQKAVVDLLVRHHARRDRAA